MVPTGALIGLDAVTAAAVGTIHSIRLVTRKPPLGLAGAPYLVERKIDVESLTEPLRVFEGSARQAAKGFPANLNVAVALSLAGIGPDRTMVEIWADPNVTRNTHRIEVDSDSARFSMTMEGIPSENPTDRPDHGPFGDCLLAQDARRASRRNVTVLLRRRLHAKKRCRSNPTMCC